MGNRQVEKKRDVRRNGLALRALLHAIDGNREAAERIRRGLRCGTAAQERPPADRKAAA
jgi:hypothetical protein